MKRVGDNIYVNLAGDTIEHSCRRKKSYKREEAISTAEYRSQETGEQISTYFCKYCKYWHIGHNNKLARSLEPRVECPYKCVRPIRQSRVENHLLRCPNRPQ